MKIALPNTQPEPPYRSPSSGEKCLAALLGAVYVAFAFYRWPVIVSRFETAPWEFLWTALSVFLALSAVYAVVVGKIQSGLIFIPWYFTSEKIHRDANEVGFYLSVAAFFAAGCGCLYF